MALCTSPLVDALPPPLPYDAPPTGVDQAHHAAPDYFSIGQAFGDVDRDGCPDLYLTDSAGTNSLWRGACDGSFTLWPDAASELAFGTSAGASFADYDNDGWLDLYVLQRGANRLLRNDGGTAFVDVTDAAGVGDPGQGQTAAWGDFDRDGDLDLYVVNWFFDYDVDSPLNRDGLYRNEGDGSFTDVSAWLTTEVLIRPGFAASFVDYDNDGDLDLYVVNDKTQGNALWRNDGAGCAGWCFTNVSVASGAHRPAYAMGLATGDYDNDGDLDFYYSSIAEAVLLENRTAQGSPTFVERSLEAGVSPDATSWGTVFIDYDNDGWLDLYLATMNAEPWRANRLYRNRGDGGFDDLSDASGCNDAGPTLGVAKADWDLDGRVDLVIGNFDIGYTLYRNQDSSGHRWLRVELEGGGPVDRDALGTRVSVRTDDGRMQLRELRSGSSLGAGDELALQFGLGAAMIDWVDVRWLDGTEQSFPAPATNQTLRLRHPFADRFFADGFETGDLTAWSWIAP
ncbi:MAG: CRTAC1 family protein [Acidobacteriota bacterium]